MTLTQALQFYGPLAALLALAFWTGGLSQRVKSLEARIKTLETGDEGDVDRREGVIVRLTRIETKLEDVSRLERTVEGLSRQIASLVTRGRRGAVPPLADTMSDD